MFQVFLQKLAYHGFLREQTVCRLVCLFFLSGPVPQDKRAANLASLFKQDLGLDTGPAFRVKGLEFLRKAEATGPEKGYKEPRLYGAASYKFLCCLDSSAGV